MEWVRKYQNLWKKIGIAVAVGLAMKYLAPLVELRPYAMAGVDLRDYPSAEIAAKYEVDSYELNYFFQAYKKARRTATVAMEERFFRRGDSLRAKSANKRRQTVASKQQ